MLFKRGENTSRKYKPCGIFFSFRKKNCPISLPPVLFRNLRKRINHGYQGTIHPLQLSVFSFFVFLCRLPTPEALLSQLPNPPKRTPDGEDPQQCRNNASKSLLPVWLAIRKALPNLREIDTVFGQARSSRRGKYALHLYFAVL